MKKKAPIIPSTEDVLIILAHAEKAAKQGNLPKLLSKNAPPEDKMKYSLCKLFVRYVNKNNLKQAALVELLKLPKTRVSDIVNYKIENYTVDRLLSYAWRLAENDPPTREHLHFVLEFLNGPVRSVKETKRIEKEVLKRQA